MVHFNVINTYSLLVCPTLTAKDLSFVMTLNHLYWLMPSLAKIGSQLRMSVKLKKVRDDHN